MWVFGLILFYKMALGSFDCISDKIINSWTSLQALVPVKLIIIIWHFRHKMIIHLTAEITAGLISNKNENNCFTTEFVPHLFSVCVEPIVSKQSKSCIFTLTFKTTSFFKCIFVLLKKQSDTLSHLEFAQWSSCGITVRPTQSLDSVVS